MYRFASFPSPVGCLTAITDGNRLLSLRINGQKHGIAPYGETLTENPSDQILIHTRDWLERYFAGKCPSPTELPLAPQGSPFRQTVWKYLLEIPYGEVTTYGDIAAHVAKDLGKAAMSAQAVGGAVGHNPISIIIPCHRVIGAKGALTGYDGGVEIKKHLLTHEGYTHFTE